MSNKECQIAMISKKISNLEKNYRESSAKLLKYLEENPDFLSGLELIRRLHGIHPQIKVVILSGHSDFAYAQQAIQYKVAHYLVKPVDEDELISEIRQIGRAHV